MSKAALKGIKEDIKAERHQEAITKCEELLKNPKEAKNATIYILLGAAYQSSSKQEAAKYLRKAVEYSDGPPITALQGLANCSAQSELPLIYAQLLNLVPEKYAEYYNKLYAISDNSLLVKQCYEIFKVDSQKCLDPVRCQLCWNYMTKIWVEANSLEIDITDEPMILSTLQQLFADEDNQDRYAKYLKLSKRLLKLLHKHNEKMKCLEYADIIADKYPLDSYAFEMICSIYCEHYKMSKTEAGMDNDDDNRRLERKLTQPIDFYAEKLMEFKATTNVAIIIKAIKLYEAQQYVAARDLLEDVQKTEESSYKILATNILFNISKKIGAYLMTLRLYTQLPGHKETDEEYAYYLSHTNQTKKLNEAVKILQSSDLKNNNNLNVLARCYFKLNEKEKLLQLSNDLDILNKAECQLLSTQKAIDEIRKQQNNIESYEILMLLGKLYLQANNYSLALNCILKATRLQPYRSECYHYLGRIYHGMNDIVRSKKCFEKCINLDPLCEDAVYNLSSMYQQLNEQDSNVALLVNTLKHMGDDVGAQRLHYKLGLHYLTAKKWDDAIHSFRTAIKFEVSRIIYWESLGDAYAARGSYNSATRVFQKILEWDEDNQYAKLQIALIKTTLRMYVEAIEHFDDLLQRHPDYLPGLKGAAEAHVGLALNFKADHLYGRCKAHLQYAANRLECAMDVVEKTNCPMVWLYRLIAKVFMLTALMPKSLTNLSLNCKWMKKDDTSKTTVYNRAELLSASVHLCLTALKLRSNTHLWYELALCSYHTAKYNESAQEQKVYFELSENACKRAIKEKHDRWENWNMLGVLYMQPFFTDYKKSQHCFIKALQMDRKLYTVWTNLGVLYLKCNEIKLANQAFQRAQQSNPVFPNAWIGQAMIAEAIGEDEEALDLYRHCLQFEYHPESSLGYANWVCNELTRVEKSGKTQYRANIERMYADTVALDEINWYVENEEDEASVAALSFQGFLCSRKKLYRAAERAYSQAVKKAEFGSVECNKMLANLGYVYLKMKKAEKAIDVFNMITETDLKPMIGLAMAYCHLDQREEAYRVYGELVRNWESEGEDRSGNIVVAMVAILYPWQDEVGTRTLLYQCILMDNSPIQALYSACALGILHNDQQLTETILSEFKKYADNKEYCSHIAYLTSQAYLAKSQPHKALTYLQSRIHLYPHLQELRKILANFLLDNCGHKKQYKAATSQIALSTITLSHRDKIERNFCMEHSQSLIIASRALKTVDKYRSMKLLQRAVHLYPENSKAWNELRSLTL